MDVKALILTGYGINCDYETQHVFELAGAEAEKVHINELINGAKKLEDYQILALPGGFSFADNLGGGKVLMLKMKNNLDEQIQQFVSDQKLIIGICNGFQVLMKYPLLPTPDEQSFTLTHNDSARLEDRWTYLKVEQDSPCIWTKGIEKMYLPVRHGEGKFVPKDDSVLKEMQKNKQLVMRYTDSEGNLNPPYPFNPNGSVDGIAGFCGKSGRIFGLMPHPEAFIHRTNHPRWTREDVKEPEGIKIFKNAVEYAEKQLL
ncbi:MAG: phosphoribosylformylglycinamidine synthase I [archaeon]